MSETSLPSNQSNEILFFFPKQFFVDMILNIYAFLFKHFISYESVSMLHYEYLISYTSWIQLTYLDKYSADVSSCWNLDGDTII